MWAPAHSCPLPDRHIWAVICTLLSKPPSEPGMDGVGRYIVAVVQSLSRVRLFATPWTAARQAYLSFTASQSLPEFMSIESVMPSNFLIFCHPLLLLSIFHIMKIFSNEWADIECCNPKGALGNRTVLGNPQTSVRPVETPFPSTAVCGMWASHLISLSLDFSVYKMGL